VPYAVELGVKVREEAGSRREIHGLQVQGAYLLIEEWDVRWRRYQLNNSTEQELTVLVEHPRTAHYELFDTPEPKERTDEHVRFEMTVAERSEIELRVQERRLMKRREELQKQSYRGLQQYLQQGLLDREACDKVGEVLGLWERISDNQERLKEVDQERKNIFEAQTQIQGSMGALSVEGKEGSLRARYVQQLEAKEDRLRALEQREERLKVEIEQLKQEIQALIRSLE
jgi:chaperonin cofactor prefoldin